MSGSRSHRSTPTGPSAAVQSCCAIESTCSGTSPWPSCAPRRPAGRLPRIATPSPSPVSCSAVCATQRALLFQEPNPSALQYHLEELVDFVRFARREQEWHPTSCPMALIARLLGAASELGLRQCTGIVSVPLFLNGELVIDPGYHAATGKITAFSGALPPYRRHPPRPRPGRPRCAAAAVPGLPVRRRPEAKGRYRSGGPDRARPAVSGYRSGDVARREHAGCGQGQVGRASGR